MPAVTFKGAADVTHCGPMVRNGASTNVFVNGIGISRETDKNTNHLKPPKIKGKCPKHAKGIASGSSSVKVNGLGCGRVGDSISGCTSVAQGSSNVFAGG